MCNRTGWKRIEKTDRIRNIAVMVWYWNQNLEHSQLSKYQLKCSAVTFAVHRFRLMFWHLASSAWRSTQCTVCTTRPDYDTISLPFFVFSAFSFSFYLICSRSNHSTFTSPVVTKDTFTKLIYVQFSILFTAAQKSLPVRSQRFMSLSLCYLSICF